MTTSWLRKHAHLTIAAVLLFASASFAQTTTMTLTGVGNGAIVWGSQFGVYVDPYTATVGGVPGTSVVCDDWSNDSYLNESWTANVISVTSLNNGTNTASPMFGALSAAQNPTPNPVSLTQAQLYDEVAWLASNLMANPTNYNNQVATSFALWELTYSAAGSGQEIPTPTNFLSGSAQSGLQSTVNSLLGQAQTAMLGGYTGTGWSILTPIPGTILPNNEGVPQEFLVDTPVPEASTIVMFGVAALALLAMAFSFRRRLALQPVI